MYVKIALSLAVLISVVSSVPISPSTLVRINSTEVKLPTKLDIPPDNGGNYGDNLWGDFRDGDQLVLREVRINPIQNRDSQWKWTYNSPSRQIVHIRCLNIGRERAYVESLTSDSQSASAIIDVAASEQFRLLIEVYTD